MGRVQLISRDAIPNFVASRLVHEGAVTVVVATADRKGLVTAGLDGRVCWWAQVRRSARRFRFSHYFYFFSRISTP